jgi:uncharacterized protein
MRRQRALPRGPDLVLDLRAPRRIHGALVDGLAAQHKKDRYDPQEGGGRADDQGYGHQAPIIGDRWACVTIAALALYDRIQTELVESRRRRDDVTLDTLSLLKSELVKASKESAAAGRIDDELVVRLTRKEVKRREEAIEVYRKAGRDDSARREEAEMVVLKSFLPAAMAEADVEAEVAAVIALLKPEGPKGFGMVMKEATARLAGRAEGAQVAAAARKLLGS